MFLKNIISFLNRGLFLTFFCCCIDLCYNSDLCRLEWALPYIILFSLLFLSLLLIITTNIIKVVTILILMFILTTLIILMLGQIYIGINIIIIYLGSILVFVLFILMLLNENTLKTNRFKMKLSTLYVFFFLFKMISTIYIFLDYFLLILKHQLNNCTFIYESDLQSLSFYLYTTEYYNLLFSVLILLLALILSVTLINESSLRFTNRKR